MSNNPYVFISYAHLDSEIVLPCVNAMRSGGINLWYDEGIEAGSEWPEFIAEKVVDCTKFVLFISRAYLNSQNCKRELNFAISRKKDILSIFIEDVELSPGMEMQLGTYQSIYRNRFSDANQFVSSLCNEAYFNACRGTGAAGAAPTVNYTTTTIGGNSFASFGSAKPFAKNRKTGRKKREKSRVVAGILGILLGGIGVHKFYLGKIGLGIVYLLFCWTYIPGIIGFIEGLIILCSTDEKFNQKYN